MILVLLIMSETPKVGGWVGENIYSVQILEVVFWLYKVKTEIQLYGILESIQQNIGPQDLIKSLKINRGKAISM